MSNRDPFGRRTARYAGRVAAACLALSSLGSLAAPPAPRSESHPTLAGDPFRGREVFVSKGCSRCHSIWGHGGTLGPDISVAVAGKTRYELIGEFWNHTPRMIDEVGERGYAWPTLDAREMADVLSYLYYLRLFDDPGDAARGADTFTRLRCGSCHTLGGQGGRVGGPLDRFGAHPSPGPLAQAMWNAGPRMQREQLREGAAIPKFTGHEMADIQAYIRSRGLRRDRDVVLQPLPDPGRGADVFRAKRCGACHDEARRNAPDITRAALSKTVAQTTGLLWNHSYAMGAQMGARGVPFPKFAGAEMSDLIAYLYFLGYAGSDGDPSRGSAVFREKGCADCHRGGLRDAPDLTAAPYRGDTAALAAAMWNHAPQMHRLMADRPQFWPKFEPGEMRDLAAYLRRPPVQAAARAR